MPTNPFTLKAAFAELDAKGIKEGDTVRVSWEVDPAYGGGTHEHTGVLKVLDRQTGWFEVDPSNRTPGHLRSTIVAFSTRMEKVGEHPTRTPPWEEDPDEDAPKPNPFIAKAVKDNPQKSTNPFIAKARS